MSTTHTSVSKGEIDHAECRAVADALARVGNKWAMMVLGSLSRGVLRYNEIHRMIDSISQRMLTLTLKGLEQDMLISRTVYPTIPPRVDYELTECGRKLIVTLQSLHNWTLEYQGKKPGRTTRIASED